MSIRDVIEAFNKACDGKYPLRGATMDYVEGGRKQLFKFDRGGGQITEVLWDGPTNNELIAAAAIKQITA